MLKNTDFQNFSVSFKPSNYPINEKSISNTFAYKPQPFKNSISNKKKYQKENSNTVHYNYSIQKNQNNNILFNMDTKRSDEQCNISQSYKNHPNQIPKYNGILNQVNLNDMRKNSPSKYIQNNSKYQINKKIQPSPYTQKYGTAINTRLQQIKKKYQMQIIQRQRPATSNSYAENNKIFQKQNHEKSFLLNDKYNPNENSFSRQRSRAYLCQDKIRKSYFQYQNNQQQILFPQQKRESFCTPSPKNRQFVFSTLRADNLNKSGLSFYNQVKNTDQLRDSKIGEVYVNSNIQAKKQTRESRFSQAKIVQQNSINRNSSFYLKQSNKHLQNSRISNNSKFGKINHNNLKSPKLQKSFIQNERNSRFTNNVIQDSDQTQNAKQRSRIGSIQKINLKIRDILRCLNQNQKKSYTQQIIKQQQPSANNLANQQTPAINSFRINTNQIKKANNDNHLKMNHQKLNLLVGMSQPSKKQNQNQKKQILQKQNPISKFEQKINKQYQRYQSSQRKNSNITQYLKDSMVSKQRSTSVIPIKNRNQVIRRQLSSSKTILSSGKDLDEQIQKIQAKIRKSDEQKRKLNIKFEERKQYQRPRNKQDNNNNERRSRFDCQNDFEKWKIEKERLRQECIQNKQRNILKHTSSFNIGQDVKIQNTLTFQEKNHRNSYKYTNQSFQSRPTYANYYIPKPNRTQNKTNKLSRVTSKYLDQKIDVQQHQIQKKRLITNLCEQVQMDQQLRTLKSMFSRIQQQQKWQTLWQLLWGRQFNDNEKTFISNRIRSVQDLKKQFDMTIQQNNPFYSTSQLLGEQLQNQLIDKYINCQIHFINKIQGKFSKKILFHQSQDYKLEDKLDLQRKGFLTVQDFVRFLNMQTGTFYRNRDLVLLYRRFVKKDENIRFDRFKQVLCD